MLYCFAAVCGNSEFLISAGIYSDVLICSGLWNSSFAVSAGIHSDVSLCSSLQEQLILSFSRDLKRFIASQRFAEIASSQYQQGFIAIYCFVAVCGNSSFTISAWIYIDVSLSSGFREQLLRTFCKGL